MIAQTIIPRNITVLVPGFYEAHERDRGYYSEPAQVIRFTHRLAEQGHSLTLFDAISEQPTIKEARDRIVEQRPDILMISFGEYPKMLLWTRELLEELDESKPLVIVGGVVMRNRAVREITYRYLAPHIDISVIGAGELPMQLCGEMSFDLARIRNATSEAVRIAQRRGLLQMAPLKPFDPKKFPPLRFYDLARYEWKALNHISGCRSRCAFCVAQHKKTRNADITEEFDNLRRAGAVAFENASSDFCIDPAEAIANLSNLCWLFENFPESTLMLAIIYPTPYHNEFSLVYDSLIYMKLLALYQDRIHLVSPTNRYNSLPGTKMHREFPEYDWWKKPSVNPAVARCCQAIEDGYNQVRAGEFNGWSTPKKLEFILSLLENSLEGQAVTRKEILEIGELLLKFAKRLYPDDPHVAKVFGVDIEEALNRAA